MLDFAFIPIFFLTGIATSIQPCLLPLIPTYLSYLMIVPSPNQQDDQHTAKYGLHSKKIKEGIQISLFMSLGILVVFLSIAFLVKLGQFWISSFLIRYTVEFFLILALILLLLGFVMLFNKDLPFFYNLSILIPLPNLKKMENKLLASFLLGLTYTIIAAPCATPIFLSLFATILFLDPISVIILIIIYALGTALPFLMIGALFPNLQYSRFSKYVRPISGIILLILSFYLLTTYVYPYYQIIQ